MMGSSMPVCICMYSHKLALPVTLPLVHTSSLKMRPALDTQPLLGRASLVISFGAPCLSIAPMFEASGSTPQKAAASSATNNANM